MAQAVEHNFGKVIIANQLVKTACNFRRINRRSDTAGNNQIIIVVLFSKRFPDEILFFLMGDKHLRDCLREKNFADAGCSFRQFQHQNGLTAVLSRRENVNDLLIVELLKNRLADPLNLFLHVDISCSVLDAFLRNIHAIPCQR